MIGYAIEGKNILFRTSREGKDERMDIVIKPGRRDPFPSATS